MLQVDKYKSGIKIKKSNRGKFTSYCGGEVTSACIQKGKHSSNPAIRKRATFAANARKWKHQHGGPFSMYSPMPQDNTRVIDQNGWTQAQRADNEIKLKQIRALQRQRAVQPQLRPWTESDRAASQRREADRKRAEFLGSTYHMWQIDPTRPYPKTDQEMLASFDNAGRAGEPIRQGLAITAGAAAGKQIVNTGRDIVQSFTTPQGRALWGGAAKDMLQFWKPSSSSMVNIGKTYIIGDEVVAPAIDKGLDIYYKSQEPSLDMQYNGVQTNQRVMEAINNGDEGLREIFTDQ